MANLDAPLIPSLTTLSGKEQLVTVLGNEEKGLKVNGILGLLSGDVATGVTNAGAITKRLSVITGTTPSVALPAVAGDLREVVVMNTASGTCTLTTPGSEKILTGTADADTLDVATGKSARLMSDGTRWYHVTNDA